jgi:polyketide cyclase/dehydrase/lipid transport protein
MDRWTSTAQAKATPERLLEVLTHPQQIRRWSPVDFDIDDLTSRRLAAGTQTKVTGRVAGVPVSFDVRVLAADPDRLELSAEGPIGLDVRYDLAPAEEGAEMTASVRVRGRGGLTGRVVASAATTLLSAGALDGATGRIARVAEAQPLAAAA